MSGDSLPLALPLSRFATGACEVTDLYRELREPLLRYLVCLGLSRDEAQDVVQDSFLFASAPGFWRVAGEHSRLGVSRGPQSGPKSPGELSSTHSANRLTWKLMRGWRNDA